jgi:hypothetical protein
MLFARARPDALADGRVFFVRYFRKPGGKTACRAKSRMRGVRAEAQEDSKAMAGSPDAVHGLVPFPFRFRRAEAPRTASRRLADGFRSSRIMREDINV